MRHYVTVCRREQLPILLISMRRHCTPFHLHVLAWDWEWYGPPTTASVSIVNRADFLRVHPEMDPVLLPGPKRTVLEQVCTVRWRFVVDTMVKHRSPVTLIDGDLWFWSSPDPMFGEVEHAPVAFCAHGFAPRYAGQPGVTHESHAKYGRYNGGFVHFNEIEVADKMAELTRQWSYSGFLTHADGTTTFGDQGWLERLPTSHVVRHHGVNVGPWNVHTRQLRDTHDGAVFFGGKPLIAYHYSSFKHGIQFANAEYEISPEQERILYEPYAAAWAASR
jgi:hypothetical protein